MFPWESCKTNTDNEQRSKSPKLRPQSTDNYPERSPSVHLARLEERGSVAVSSGHSHRFAGQFHLSRHPLVGVGVCGVSAESAFVVASECPHLNGGIFQLKRTERTKDKNVMRCLRRRFYRRILCAFLPHKCRSWRFLVKVQL